MSNDITILFLHGFPFNRSMWHGVVARLEGRVAARLIAGNLRGFDGRPIASPVTTMDDFADDIEPVDPRRLIVCGLSMGGYVALTLAARYSDNLAGLILCDTKVTADPPDVAASRQTLADELIRGEKTLADVAASMLPRLLSPATGDELAHEVAAVITSHDVSGIAAAARGMAVRHDSTSLLPKLKVPTLVVCGEDDAISPPDEMHAWANLIPNATFQTIPHAGHISPWEQPELVADAIADFVGQKIVTARG
ncbi:MAG: alpha/beta fold hydrolase [Thermoguttaceae bacterium]